MLTNVIGGDMEEEWSGTLGGKGARAQSVYQPSSGEKHVLFYPTSSPTVSATGSDEPRSWGHHSPNASNNHSALQHVSFLMIN